MTQGTGPEFCSNLVLCMKYTWYVASGAHTSKSRLVRDLVCHLEHSSPGITVQSHCGYAFSFQTVQRGFSNVESHILEFYYSGEEKS